MNRALLQKLIVTQLVKFPTSYGTLRLLAVFTRSRHWSLSWARCIQSTPSHPIYPWSSRTLFSHLRLRLPSGIFCLGSSCIFFCLCCVSEMCAMWVSTVATSLRSVKWCEKKIEFTLCAITSPELIINVVLGMWVTLELFLLSCL
jgi:hypothetical protein